MESSGRTFRVEISCDSTAKAVAYTPTKKSRDHADLVGIGRFNRRRFSNRMLTRLLSPKSRICCRQQCLIVVVAQIAKETADSTKRLAQEKIGGVVCLRRGIAVSTHKLKLGIPTAQDTGRCKKIHGRAGDPFLDELHIEDRLAIGDERAIDREIEAPDQPAKIARRPAQLLTLHRHVWHTNSRAESIHSGRPRFPQTARWFQHRVVDFLELHARAAHPDQGNE